MIPVPDTLGLALIVAATWRVTSLLVQEAGPFRLATRLRTKLGILHDDNGDPISWPDGFWGSLFGCVWCLSWWVGLMVYFAWWLSPLVVLPAAISALAILFHRVIESTLRG